MTPFYGWGSTASRLEPLQWGSLLFTTKISEIWYSFYRPQKDERLSRPWSHPVVLNTSPLDWESNTLTFRPLLHKMLERYTKYFKGSVSYIFTSLFCRSKRKHLWIKIKCFYLTSLPKLFRSWDNKILTF